jgi:DNA-binding transcriptional ArsR family regulator
VTASREIARPAPVAQRRPRARGRRRAGAGTTVFKAIADPTRRAMLDRLLAGECAAGELMAGRRRMSQPALSQHLSVLRRANLVAQRRDGRRRLYRINPEPLREIYDWVEHYRRFWDARLDALALFLEEEREREQAAREPGTSDPDRARGRKRKREP